MMDIFASYGNIIKTSFNDNIQYIQYLSNPIILEQDKEKQNRYFVLILNFDTNSQKIDVEYEEITSENKEEIAKKYLWIGNTPDTTNRYITTDKKERIFEGINKNGKNNNPLFHLMKKLENTELGNKIANIFTIFYPDINNQFINLYKFQYFDLFCEELFKQIQNYNYTTNKSIKKDLQKNFKFLPNEQLEKLVIDSHSNVEFKNNLIKIINLSVQDYITGKRESLTLFHNFLLQLLGKSKNEIKLITIKIDGLLIPEMPEYINFLYMEKVPQPIITEKASSNSRICSVCGIKSNSITAEYLKKAKVKFFNTDKIIFSTNLSEKFDYNYSLCNKCFENLIIGEKFILTQFRKKWARNSVMIIPEITPIEQLNIDNIEQIKSQSSLINDTIYSFEEKRYTEKLIEELMDIIPSGNLVFHYIFFTVAQGGKPNKIFAIIKDVPPTRLNEILMASQQIKKEKCIQPKVTVDLKQIYFSIPVRLDKKTKRTKGKDIVFDLYDAIFHKLLLDPQLLIEKFVRVLRAIFLDTTGLNVSVTNPKRKLTILKQKILLMNIILEFLEKINSLKEYSSDFGVLEKMSNINKNDSLQIEIDKYWANKSVYNINESRALFLYGIMLADVGIAQKRKLKSEPILSKVNFAGMNRAKIIYLVNEIIDKQIKYKDRKNMMIYNYDKQIHAQAQKYFESIEDTKWKLTTSENVFYLMSGYAFKKEYLQTTDKGNESEEYEDNEISNESDLSEFEDEEEEEQPEEN